MELDLSLLQGEFDCVILGTGLIECTLSGVLSKEGLRVLVLDKNEYYGGGCASLSLSQLYQQFKGVTDNGELIKQFGGPQGKDLEQRRWLNQWNIDLIPKFIMGSGLLVRILIHTGVTKYLEFQKAAGSYVFKAGKIHKVPSSASEALASSLMGFFEKRRCAKLLQFIEKYDPANPQTHEGLNCAKLPFKAVCDKFGVDENTRSFLGHAVALYSDDGYLDKPATEVIERVVLYRNSFFNLQGGSPYLYPRHGLSELPQGFARQGAVYGATTMLRAPYKEVVYTDGVATGIKLKINETEDFEVKCKYILGDPSYFPDKVKEVGKVLRVVCILDQAIPNTNNAHSAQIIIPQKESGRSHDIYVICLSSMHCVAPEGKYLAIISMELDEKEANADPLKLFGGVIKLLGNVRETVVMPVSTLYAPNSDGKDDSCFISESYNGASHFQDAARNILNLYQRITGKELELTNGEPQE